MPAGVPDFLGLLAEKLPREGRQRSAVPPCSFHPGMRVPAQALRTPSETPERLWSASMAAALADELAHLSALARAAQVGAAPVAAVTPFMPQPALSSESQTCIGTVPGEPRSRRGAVQWRSWDVGAQLTACVPAVCVPAALCCLREA